MHSTINFQGMILKAVFAHRSEFVRKNGFISPKFDTSSDFFAINNPGLNVPDVDQMQQKIEIPVKSLVELETTLQDVAENTQQPLNVNPIVVLQSGDFDPSMGYPAIEPSTMQQLLILAPTRVTPVCKGPLKLKNPQISVACPVNSDIDTQNPNAETRSAGLNEKDIDMIARKYMIPIPASDESSKLEELESFAKDFRTRRIRLGYTQNDVGLSLGWLSNRTFHATNVEKL